jgi:hypothetical protein
MPKPKPRRTKSSLVNALTRPYILEGKNVGVLYLKNIVKRNQSGEPVELIKLLMSGAHQSPGAYSPGLGVRVHTGVWKGFPASYWMRWDNVFTVECMKMKSAIRLYCLHLGEGNFQYGEKSFKTAVDVVNAVETGVIKRI